MKKTRNLLCLLALAAFTVGPAYAVAADDPTSADTVPIVTDTSSDTSTDTAPLTLDQDQIEALQEAAGGADEEKSTFEKASDFVTDNAPWFIIGIIVLAAIIAGILIMRGRPRRAKVPKASKSDKSMRQAGGLGASGEPAQVPSASELRRRKRAAIQRSREEERMRRKAGIDNRKAARQGAAGGPVATPAPGPTVPPVAAPVAAGAGVAAGTLDPVEAEKQGARDQQTAAAAVARLGGGAVPAPVSPSQTAPAAGVVTAAGAGVSAVQPVTGGVPLTQKAPPTQEVPLVQGAPPATGPATEASPGPDTAFEPAPASTYGAPVFTETAPPTTEFSAPQEPETSVLHEPSLEAPGPDAAVGNAAGAFLAAGAAGAAGGLVGAHTASSSPGDAAQEDLPEPMIAPEPGMSAESALGTDPDEVARPGTGAPAGAGEPAPTSFDDERLRAKVAEIKATQESPSSTGEPAPLGPDAELSPGLAAVERKLARNSEERDRALRDAEQRLRMVEQRAEDAERRAAFAERLAQLKIEESDREKRLNDVVSGIDRAEQRAREAEARAESAEKAAAEALGRTELNVTPLVPKPYAQEAPPEVLPTGAPTPSATPAEEAQPADVVESTEPVAPERKGLFGGTPAGTTPAGSADSDALNLNSATFEELREAGMSVTQATRILAYRERFGGYGSVDDLEKVPGFPADLIESLRGRLST